MADPMQGKCDGRMVKIPDSRFMMGSEGGAFRADETPRHEVRVTDFYMDQHEVTNSAYAPFAALKYELTKKDCKSGKLLSIVARDNDVVKLAEALKASVDPKEEICMEVRMVEKREVPKGFAGPNQPAVMVNWFEADAFCRSQGKRLPFEAEWEKAAIGPTKGYDPKIIFGTKSGDELKPEEANYWNNKSPHVTTDVCSYPPNGNGLYDVIGNVLEWVSDGYDENYYKNSPDTNPQGPSDTGIKVLRGGSWNGGNAGGLRAARRFENDPEIRYDFIGFRCAEDSPK